jgi:UDP-N-acetylmuramoyl-L-alanyl-D-glutamate--2,6-diaminopimelate ligase
MITQQTVQQTIRQLKVRSLAVDSRLVKPGDTFLAYQGEMSDGRQYIPQAIANGAQSIVWEADGYTWNPSWKLPNQGIPDLRRQAGLIADSVYGSPSNQLWVIGVTGTNGKTSCSQWIAQALSHVGRKCAVVGTLGSGFPGRLVRTEAEHSNTTPGAVALHARLRSFCRAGARAVSMEVSSHGLVQDRLSGVRVDVAMLTNISRDHLDYHGTMRAYQAAKTRLFRMPSLSHAVLNTDDQLGTELAQRWRHRCAQLLGYGFRRQSARSRLSCVIGRNLKLDLNGMSFDVSTPWGKGKIQSALIGEFNAMNLLGSLASLLASDVTLEQSIHALAQVEPIPGRMECFGGGPLPMVVVDYAHTPDALEKILNTLRQIARRKSKIICVFGCGGDRDRGKRPLMGATVSRLADMAILTSDNPRNENPLDILEEIAAGISGECHKIVERREAIDQALKLANAGDIVLIAGKGHERYQEIDGVMRRHHDATVVRQLLARRSK